MAAALFGLLGILAILVSLVLLIVFGIIAAVKKNFKKTRFIVSGSILIVGIILFSVAYHMTNSETDTTVATSTDSNPSSSDNSSSSDSNTSTSSDDTSDSSNSDGDSAVDVEKTTKVNFVNTVGQQTTKVESAEIINAIDSGMTDDNGNDVQYALLIKMSVTNNAPEAATTYPSQGHVVLPDGTQLNAIGAADMDYTDAFKDGDIENGATVSGYVIFPLTMAQATDFKNCNFKFEVMCGDENMTTKNYDIPIKF